MEEAQEFSLAIPMAVSLFGVLLVSLIAGSSRWGVDDTLFWVFSAGMIGFGIGIILQIVYLASPALLWFFLSIVGALVIGYPVGRAVDNMLFKRKKGE